MLSSVPANERRLIAIALPATEAKRRKSNQKSGAGSDASSTGGAMAKAVAGAFFVPAAGAALLGVAATRWLSGKSEPQAQRGLPGRVHLVQLHELGDGLRFPPGHPYPGAVYGLNPVRSTTYIPLAEFHRVALREKVAELFALLAGLRAAKATIAVERGVVRTGKMNLSALIPADVPVQVSVNSGGVGGASTGVGYSMKFAATSAPRVPTGLQWFEHEPEWQALATNRLEHGLTDFKVSLRYVDSLSVGANLAAEIEGAGFSLGGNFETFEEETWTISGSFARKGLIGW